MSMRLILVAVLLLGGGALAWFSLQPNGAPPAAVEAPAPTVKILVTTAPTQAGTLLKDADIREQDVAPGEVTKDNFLADDTSKSEIRGAMLRRYLESGAPVRRADVLRPRDRGFLAAVLAPGTRAVSISVDATTGASGLIAPGDLVDVLLTQEFTHGETSAGRRVVAETVLSTVRVIAVDQQIAQGAPAAGSGLIGSQANRIASNVSLEVNPEQAAKVVVAGRLGRLTLVVRSIDGDPGLAEHGASPAKIASARKSDALPAPTVYGSDVSSALSNDQPAVSPRLRLIQGDAVSDVVFK